MNFQAVSRALALEESVKELAKKIDDNCETPTVSHKQLNKEVFELGNVSNWSHSTHGWNEQFKKFLNILYMPSQMRTAKRKI